MYNIHLCVCSLPPSLEGYILGETIVCPNSKNGTSACNTFSLSSLPLCLKMFFNCFDPFVFSDPCFCRFSGLLMNVGTFMAVSFGPCPTHLCLSRTFFLVASSSPAKFLHGSTGVSPIAPLILSSHPNGFCFKH